ncbi:Ppx/GppA family phosphatase [Paenibacillus sp. CAA11]|uniref:Ppx/GppA family phosphatase n=1 Tax=Paenibacillus sp. CAA11 TaxID=1532905 RepID=UPI000D3AA6A9|nr:Ppx/GppA family phosphatase [Paenibacillus sp. CAA11]AWB45644.1 Ppx/GppA family phosphatase [Paenibacillus sp. CAA11]
MKQASEHIAIIDIGSNSIRLVIYETSRQGDYRLIEEYKESARLSEKVKPDGDMDLKGVLTIVPVLSQFRQIAEVYHCRIVRVTATAAIRNAGNAAEVVALLNNRTGLRIELLSGEQEAYFGFRGVAASIGVRDGFIIDIGGGSTEITFFQDRTLQHSISLPYGAVNSYVKFGKGVDFGEDAAHELRSRVERELDRLPWLKGHTGLPLIGLGGTIRALGKLDQRRRKYPLRNTHHYELSEESIDYYMKILASRSLEQRKRMEGLSKSRADIIVPGLIILHTIYGRIGATYCLISGTGLREGLLLDTIGAEMPSADQVVERQIASLLFFHSTQPPAHLQRVSDYAQQLRKVLSKEDDPVEKRVLHTAAMLYKMGRSLGYPDADKHTRYWLTHAPLTGLTHREIALCSLITEFRANEGKRVSFAEYKDMFSPGDEDRVLKLGALLLLATALDASGTGMIEEVQFELENKTLHLKLKSRAQPFIECRELDTAQKIFKKLWDLKLKASFQDTSTN